MKAEFIMTIIMTILCNVAFALAGYSIPETEVPFWVKHIPFAVFNIIIGMVIMNYMYQEKQK